MNRIKFAASTLAAAVTMLFAASASHAGTLLAPNYGDNQVASYSVANGTGTAVPGSPFGFVGPPNASGLIAFAGTPDGTRGAAAFLFEGGYQGVTIAPGGEIAAAQTTLSGAEGTSIAISPISSRAYIATRDLGFGLRIYDFSASGAMNEIAGSPAAAGEEYYEVAITPDGKYLFAVSAAGVTRYVINADGSVSSLGLTGPAGVYRLQVSPDGRFMFGLNADSSAMQSYAIGADGSLAPIEAEGLAGNTDSAFTVSPDGKFLFVPNPSADVVQVLTVANDGSMTVTSASGGISEPQTAVTSVDGRFLYVGDDDFAGLGLKVATIGPDGTLGAWTPLFPWTMSTAARISFRTAQAPIAVLSEARRVAPGKGARFDASRTTIPLGSLGRFEWNFGDGTIVADGGATPTHKYAKAGVYDVTVRAHDSDGCSTQLIHTGQTTLCNGGPQAVSSIKFDTLPLVSRLRVKPSKFKRRSRKARITFRLSERANARVIVQRRTAGRRVGKSCRKATRRNRRRAKCVRWVRTGRIVKRRARAGSNTYRFRGKIGRKTLNRGSYRMAVYAVDSAKGRSSTVYRRFRVR
ncbi:MAG: PKD domain-containing protein [Solirubrobacterales bacterium]